MTAQWPESSERVWDSVTAFSFALSMCATYWSICFAASFGPAYVITFHALHYSVGTGFLLMMSAAILPAIYCFSVYPECRSSLWKLNASPVIYALALTVGFLPFASYGGSASFDFPWGRPVLNHLLSIIAYNIFLTPLAEEIVWRGCFYKKVRAFCSAKTAILWMSIGWVVWHGGYITFLFSAGIPSDVLKVLPLTYFFTGIILGALFELGRGSLLPCILLHALFDASTVIYYDTDNRVTEIASYVADAIAAGLVAVILFWIVSKRVRED